MSRVKSPLEVRALRLKEVASEAREQLGRELFEVTRIDLLMGEEAVKGFTSLTILPPRPLDLRETAAARRLVGQLTGAGLRCEWEPRRTAGTDGPALYALVINW